MNIYHHFPDILYYADCLCNKVDVFRRKLLTKNEVKENRFSQETFEYNKEECQVDYISFGMIQNEKGHICETTVMYCALTHEVKGIFGVLWSIFVM